MLRWRHSGGIGSNGSWTSMSVVVVVTLVMVVVVTEVVLGIVVVAVPSGPL